MGIDIAEERKERAKKIQSKNEKDAKRKQLKTGIEAFKKGYSGADWICTQCGNPGKPISITKGSLLLEIMLWLCFLLPGILYSLWRLSTRYKGCRDCKTKTMVKINSPTGQQLLKSSISVNVSK